MATSESPAVVEHPALHPDASSSARLRQEIYAGGIFLLPASAASLSLVNDVVELLTATFGQRLRDPHIALQEDFFPRLEWLRSVLSGSESYRIHHMRRLAAALGFPTGETAFEPLRLRAVLHRGHELPWAAPAYTLHRDTWYAHPAAAITAWLPLYDYSAAETFWLYPESFARPVLPNDSETFTYARGAAVRRDRDVARAHERSGCGAPSDELASDPLLGRPLSFACRKGEVLLFSSAQLHRTRTHSTGRTRFSLDCRLVALDEYASGLGAPNVDNRSRGSALVDYVRCEE
jgi:hypothetical protein